MNRHPIRFMDHQLVKRFHKEHKHWSQWTTNVPPMGNVLPVLYLPLEPPLQLRLMPTPQLPVIPFPFYSLIPSVLMISACSRVFFPLGCIRIAMQTTLNLLLIFHSLWAIVNYRNNNLHSRYHRNRSHLLR